MASKLLALGGMVLYLLGAFVLWRESRAYWRSSGVSNARLVTGIILNAVGLWLVTAWVMDTFAHGHFVSHGGL